MIRKETAKLETLRQFIIDVMSDNRHHLKYSKRELNTGADQANS
jgi:hypothetical protein